MVTGDPPPACVEAEAGGLVKKFLTAYNGGEHRMTDTYFALDGVFEEFVDPPHRTGDDARERETLDAHFAEQYRRHDRLTLSNFLFISYQPADNTGLFEMTLDRATGEPVHVQPTIECGLAQQSGAKVSSWAVASP